MHPCPPAHSPPTPPPAPRRAASCVRSCTHVAVADGAAGGAHRGGGPQLATLLHVELLRQGGGAGRAGRDAQVVSVPLRHRRPRAPSRAPSRGCACTRRCMPAACPLHARRCQASLPHAPRAATRACLPCPSAVAPPPRPPGTCACARPSLPPRPAAGTKTARCGRWWWRTRRERRATPAPCTSTAATMRCLETPGRRPSTRACMPH